jgi:hypothetical protein
MTRDSIAGAITGVVALAIVAPIAMTLFFRRMRAGSTDDSTPPDEK